MCLGRRYDVEEKETHEGDRPDDKDAENQAIETLRPMLPMVVDDSTHSWKFPNFLGSCTS